DLRTPRSRLVTSTGIRLHAPAPGWSIDADVVVAGPGAPGTTAAQPYPSAPPPAPPSHPQQPPPPPSGG
ncbi:hypothetical protein PV421_44650, partial [Streptomyces scabiei]|nr:hypothetical protein [Streptomyces scabiei]